MTTALWQLVGWLALTGFILWLLIRKTDRAGRQDAEIEQKDKAIDNVRKRQKVEDRNRADPGPADRLRKSRWNRRV